MTRSNNSEPLSYPYPRGRGKYGKNKKKFKKSPHTLHLPPVEPGRAQEVVLDGVQPGPPVCGGGGAGRGGQQLVRVGGA